MELILIISLKQQVVIANVKELREYRRQIWLDGKNHYLLGEKTEISINFRMLLVTKSHHEPDDMLPDPESTRRMSLCKESASPWTGASQFLATTNRIIQFSNGREPKVMVE